MVDRFQKFEGNGPRIFRERVLLLNKNFEPLTILRSRRALILFYLGKVELIESYDGRYVHSVNRAFPLPSVLRLAHYVKVHRKEIPLTKKNILRRDNYQCQYCGKKNVPLTTDHVVPKVSNGQDSWENLVCACIECNTKKGNRTPAEARLRLLRRPKKPHYFTFILSSLGEIPEGWRPYLFLERS